MYFQQSVASTQNFAQIFNAASSSELTAINALLHLEEELKIIAEKFRVTDSQDVTTQKETKLKKGMFYTVTSLDEALPAMRNALSDSFNTDVINGVANTRERSGSYTLTQIGLYLLGDKGVSTDTKYSQGIAKAGQFFNKGDNLAFADGNRITFLFDIATFRQADGKLSTYQFAKDEYTTVKPGDRVHLPQKEDQQLMKLEWVFTRKACRKNR